jgi:hypothetical protein
MASVGRKANIAGLSALDMALTFNLPVFECLPLAPAAQHSSGDISVSPARPESRVRMTLRFASEPA